MSDQPETEQKKCPYCGRMTSAKASFCWWCARELVARPERPDPTSTRKPSRFAWVWIVLLAALAVGVLVLVLR